MQGAGTVLHSDSSDFSQRILESVGKDTDASQVVSGGLARERVDELVKSVEDTSSDKAEMLRQQLGPHMNEGHRTGLPADSGIVTGAYTKAEAEEWIAEHENAMSEVPELRDSRGGE